MGQALPPKILGGHRPPWLPPVPTPMYESDCAGFTSRGLRAEFVGEAQTDKSVISAVLDGKVQLVYITPENIIESLKFRNMLQSTVYADNLVTLIVDEAHCVKMWGDRFRRV